MNLRKTGITLPWLLTLLLISCTVSPPPQLTDIEKPYLIDVRTEAEFNSGHLEGAIQIPYYEIGAKIDLVTANKNAQIVLYCHKGGRAEHAKETLEKIGYTNVTNAGGYIQLLESGKYQPN